MFHCVPNRKLSRVRNLHTGFDLCDLHTQFHLHFFNLYFWGRLKCNYIICIKNQDSEMAKIKSYMYCVFLCENESW